MAQQQTTAKLAPTAPLAPDPRKDLAPFVPTAANPWDEEKVRHLMRRAGFGARPEEYASLVKLGVSKAVDRLLTVSPTGLQESGYQTLTNGERVILNRRYGARPQWLHEMIVTPHPLKEKMALFWSDHFSVGTKGFEYEALLIKHINVFRRHGLGRFKDLILAVTKDPAMLWWLDNNVNGRPENGKPKINENYARELLELYTMGVDSGYSQQDIVEAAKCLSGWSTSSIDRFVYKPEWHIAGNKKFLGKQILSNGQREVYDLVDTILGHPACARFIVEKIWNYFVSETPYPALIDVLADMWRKSGYDIQYLMGTIFRSNYFYSGAAVRQLVKNPYEFVVQAMRTANAPFRIYRFVDRWLVQMGYRLMEYPDPSGYDDGVAWIDEMAMLARANFANELTRANYYSLFNPNHEITRVGGFKTKEELVDHYVAILGVEGIPQSVRGVLYLFMDMVDSGPQPFTFTPAKINEKVRGLVHLILSLPEASMN